VSSSNEQIAVLALYIMPLWSFRVNLKMVASFKLKVTGCKLHVSGLVFYLI